MPITQCVLPHCTYFELAPCLTSYPLLLQTLGAYFEAMQAEGVLEATSKADVYKVLIRNSSQSASQPASVQLRNANLPDLAKHLTSLSVHENSKQAAGEQTARNALLTSQFCHSARAGSENTVSRGGHRLSPAGCTDCCAVMPWGYTD